MLNFMLALQPKIEVEVNKGGGHPWYTSPLYVGIGVVVLLLVVLIAVTAARKG